MTRGWGLFWGLVLVLLGGLALLFNTGLLQPEQLSRVLALWPLLLIIVGLQIVLARLLPRNVAAISLSVIAFLLVASSVGYVVSAPAAHQEHSSFTVPDAGSGPATLRMELGAATVNLTSGSAAGANIDYASGLGPAPSLTWSASTRTFEISHSGSGLGFFATNSSDRVNVTLDGGRPWTIELDLGATSATLHLSDLQLAGMRVNGGADTLDLTLGSPSGHVPIAVSGGATKISLARPPGTALRVTTNGGANSLTVDGRDVSSGIGSSSWSSTNYPAADAYEVTVDGGANKVTVTSSAG